MLLKSGQIWQCWISTKQICVYGVKVRSPQSSYFSFKVWNWSLLFYKTNFFWFQLFSLSSFSANFDCYCNLRGAVHCAGVGTKAKVSNFSVTPNLPYNNLLFFFITSEYKCSATISLYIALKIEILKLENVF